MAMTGCLPSPAANHSQVGENRFRVNRDTPLADDPADWRRVVRAFASGENHHEHAPHHAARAGTWLATGSRVACWVT